MGRPVLAVTRLDDITADLVIAELHRRAVPVVRIDPGDFPDDLTLATFLDESGLRGYATTVTGELPLANVRSVYWRRPSPYQAPSDMDEQAATWAVEEARWGVGGVLANLPGALYVNHPWRVRDAESKVAQLAIAGACGFRVPTSVLTNDPTVAREFIAAHQRVVYKPVWNTPVWGEDGRARTVWVRRVHRDELDTTIRLAPHLFQVEVDKIADIRSTAVGRNVISVRIDGATGLDWRENYDELRFSIIETPPLVRKAIETYLDHFGLVFAAFDFGLGRDGQDWSYYEANAGGQWAFFDDSVTAQITNALADLLQEGTRP